MRKLVLFGLLAGVFGLALLLEHFVTRPATRVESQTDQLTFVIGGGPARELPPEIPDAPPADAAANGGRRAGARPAARPADGGARGGNEASAKARAPAPGSAPTGTPPSAPTDGAPTREHVVEKGETLTSIARAELGATGRWKDLARWNGLDEAKPLQIGMRLRLGAAEEAAKAPADLPKPEAPKQEPPPGGDRSYKIAKGDTLSGIAARFLGDAKRWREIQRLNPSADPANLTEGSTIQLPPR